MRSIADGSLDGFPDANEVKTVFVEADIQGELSHLDCVNYVLQYPAIKNLGATEEQVRDVLKKVGFSEGKQQEQVVIVMIHIIFIWWLENEIGFSACYVAKSRYSSYG